MIANEEIRINRYQALRDIIRNSSDDVITPLQMDLVKIACERESRFGISDDDILNSPYETSPLHLYLMQDGSVSLSDTDGKYLMDARLKFLMGTVITPTAPLMVLSVRIELSNMKYTSRVEYPLTDIDVRDNTPIHRRNLLKTPLVNILERIAWEIERRHRD